MFSYVRLEQRVPEDHPLRAVRKLTEQVLRSLSPGFDNLYAASRRSSIAPDYILRALLLQVFYSIGSERLLVEQIDYNLLFRWFIGPGMDDAVWNHAAFSKNRGRLLTSAVAQQFFSAVNQQAKRFMSDEHFTVDGTLIQAWVLAEELPLERRIRRRGRFELSRPTAQQLDACIDHRRRCPAVQEGLRQGVKAELSGTCLAGEPQRHRGRDGHARRWIRRALDAA
jgi:transposase